MKAIEHAWTTGGALATLLRPLGALYGALAGARAIAYRAGWLRTERSVLPVVVVGNLSVGGTGKTPLTAFLVDAFRRRGWRPGIVSRGYGGARHETPCHVRAGDASADVGDEPLMLHRLSGAPVCVCVHRARAVAALARDTDCDLVLSDDGLQHLAMARDAEIVVVDEARGFGNGRFLPAGPLRDPVSRLGGVDLIAVRARGAAERPGTEAFTATGSVTDRAANESVAGGTPPLHGVPGIARHDLATLPPAFRFALVEPRASRWPNGERVPLAAFAGRRVHAVAGIARPERFFATLAGHGLDPDARALPDHHPIAASDLAFDDADPVFVTRKDAVRLDGVQPLPDALYVVDLDVATDASAAALLDALSTRLRELATGRAAHRDGRGASPDVACDDGGRRT